MSAAPTLSDLRRPDPRPLPGGGAAARERAAALDRAVAGLAAEAGLAEGTVAVVAVGGYGRGDLSPHSDVDLLFLKGRRDAPRSALREVLYPLWDAGFQVGHAVRTPREAIEHAERDLTAATALLHARPVTGDGPLARELLDRRARWLRRAARRIVRRILEATAERHRARPRAGWALAPDLKEDVGGLRDVHVLEWLERAAGIELPAPELGDAVDVLLSAREALHAQGKRKNDCLRIDLQPAVASRLGVELDELMARIHSAARVVEHVSERERGRAATVLMGGPRRSGSLSRVRPGVDVVDGVLVARPGLEPLELLAAHAATGRPPTPEAVARLARAFAEPAARSWDDARRDAFLDLLRGPHAPAALELLDHVGGFAVLLPEWNGIRGRAQHDPYHRYTVDGHTFLAVGEVTRALEEEALRGLSAELGDVRALYLGTLFHDIGKGSGEDHCVAGERLARAACARLGFPADVVEDVALLVRRHLLLPDTATRRDLDDGAVVEEVARGAGTARRLRMLYVLAVADGRATGPRAWNEWKAALVRELYRKALRALETGDLPARGDVAARAKQVEALDPELAGHAEPLLSALPPSYLASVPPSQCADELRLLLDASGKGGVDHRVESFGEHTVVTAVVPNRPGALARSAGVLTLARISVLRSQAYSAGPLALQRLVVAPPETVDWQHFGGTLVAVHSGRLALEEEVERKAADYRPSRPGRVDIRFPDVSAHSTVVEVRTRDRLGLLYAVTAAMADLGIDIRVAKIDTMGERVVDVFYVRGPDGGKLDDDQKDAVRRAVTHRIGRVLD